jgi:nitrate reductase cytochrome c-type subunit
MKMMRKISMMIAMIMVASLTFMSCTKEGPAGLPGKDGKDGADGTNGVNGQDGTAGCIVCHDNNQVNFAVTQQWEMSKHATGGLYVRNSNNCAGCHTSQGFREMIASATPNANTAGTIQNPVPPNCYTCHNIHSTYTPADWSLSTTANVTLRIKPEATHDFGKGNLCATCHQPRIPSPMPVLGGPDVTITSANWGPHYGAQATIVSGKGGFEFGTGYTNSFHTAGVANSCVGCHGGDANGMNGGGHMFNLGYTTSSGADAVITATCTSCHTDATSLNALMALKKEELNTLLLQLRLRLKDIGIMDANTERVVPGTWTSAQAGAFINHNLVKYDHSNGVHNFPYAKKLLENSIAAIQ